MSTCVVNAEMPDALGAWEVTGPERGYNSYRPFWTLRRRNPAFDGTWPMGWEPLMTPKAQAPRRFYHNAIAENHAAKLNALNAKLQARNPQRSNAAPSTEESVS